VAEVTDGGEEEEEWRAAKLASRGEKEDQWRLSSSHVGSKGAGHGSTGH
jgi:hypothetical protein